MSTIKKGEVAKTPPLLQSLLPFWACMTMFAPSAVTLQFLSLFGWNFMTSFCSADGNMSEMLRAMALAEKGGGNKVASSKGS